MTPRKKKLKITKARVRVAENIQKPKKPTSGDTIELLIRFKPRARQPLFIFLISLHLKLFIFILWWCLNRFCYGMIIVLMRGLYLNYVNNVA